MLAVTKKETRKNGSRFPFLLAWKTKNVKQYFYEYVGFTAFSALFLFCFKGFAVNHVKKH